MLGADYENLEPTNDLLLFNYQGVPFTGIGYECDNSGTLVSEVSFSKGFFPLKNEAK